MSTRPDYSDAWRDYRRRRLVFWAVFLGYVPGVMLILFAVGLPLSALSGIKPDYFAYPVAGAWMLAFLIASVRLSWFRCPCCHKWFFATFWYHNPLAQECVHCGLPKWADSD